MEHMYRQLQIWSTCTDSYKYGAHVQTVKNMEHMYRQLQIPASADN